MKHILLVVFMFFTTTVLLAQNEVSYEIGLTNGKVLYPNQLKHNSGGLSKKHFLVDGEKYLYNQVKYYRDEEKYYLKANPTGYGDDFYLRELDGEKVKTYSVVKTYYSGGGPGQVGTFSSSKIDYYQKRGGRLRSVTYSDLAYDLKDNPLSMQKLNEVKKIRNINAFIYTASAAMFIGGLVATANSAKRNESLPPSERDVSFSPFVFIGVITANIPWFTGGAKQKKLNEALELYNK